MSIQSMINQAMEAVGLELDVSADPATVEGQLQIVLEGLRLEGGIEDLCQQHGITADAYQQWLMALVVGGEKQLEAAAGMKNSPGWEGPVLSRYGPSHHFRLGFSVELHPTCDVMFR